IPVENLLAQGITSVPEAYIQPHPPIYGSQRGNSTQIPVIDLTLPEEEITDAIARACKDWGFFQVISHGVAQEIVDGMLQAAKDFFDLPMAVRMKYFSATPIPKTTGYSVRFDNSSVVDWRDFLFQSLCYPPCSDAVKESCPSDPPHYRDSSARYCEAMHDLGRKLLRYVSRGLGLESNRIEQSLEELHHSMLMNRYLPCPQPELVLALRSHTDPNVISLLVDNGVPGLQVLKDGAWITVHSLPGAIVVNMGDQLEIMSNGKYKSAEHRALANSDSTRYSIASFFEPPPAGPLIAPFPELVNAQEESQFQAVCYRDYLAIFFAKQASGKSVITQVKK
ncbi:2-oxoacid-dependent dioxygenase, partial [Selaginella moellendorffii]